MDVLLRVSLRLDHTKDTINDYNDYLVSRVDNLFGVFENPSGDNPHLHYCFTINSDFNKFKDSFRNNFKKVFPIDKKKSYAFSRPKSEMTILYNCKGPKAISNMANKDYPGDKVPPIVVYKGTYTDDQIQRLHEQWWDDAKRLKVGKIEKTTKLNLIDDMLSSISKEFIDGKPKLTRRELIGKLIDYYVRTKRVIRYSQLIEYVDTLWLIINNTYYKKIEYENVRESIIDKVMSYEEKKF